MMAVDTHTTEKSHGSQVFESHNHNPVATHTTEKTHGSQASPKHFWTSFDAGT
jgi:hypothetical protein